MGWGGGQPAIWVAGQLPAAVMDGPMMGPAQQDQVGQVGRAAVQPMPEMMASHQARGRWRSGKRQPPSRTARAVCWVG